MKSTVRKGSWRIEEDPHDEHDEDEDACDGQYVIVTDEDGNTTITIYFHGYISAKGVSKTVESLHFWDAQYPESEWEVVINSEGGEMDAGTALYSTLYRFSQRGGGTHHIRTRVAGRAASAASLIFQAGDERLIGRMDFIMVHEPVCTFVDEPISNIRHSLAHADMWTDQYVDVCLERSDVERDWFVEQFAGKDWWIPAKEALSIGLVDGIE